MLCLVWGPFFFFPSVFSLPPASTLYSVLRCHLEGSGQSQGSAAFAFPLSLSPGSDFPIVISANTDTEAPEKAVEGARKRDKIHTPYRGSKISLTGLSGHVLRGLVRPDPEDHRPH